MPPRPQSRGEDAAVPVPAAASFTFGVVVDTSGRAGWKAQASAPAPSSGAAARPALQLTGGSWSCVFGYPTDSAPTGVSYPVTLSAARQTIYNAAAGSGRGKFDVASTFLVSGSTGP